MCMYLEATSVSRPKQQRGHHLSCSRMLYHQSIVGYVFLFLVAFEVGISLFLRPVWD